MPYLQVTIPVPDTATAEQLIATLSERGFEGFEETGQSLMAFISEESFRESFGDPFENNSGGTPSGNDSGSSSGNPSLTAILSPLNLDCQIQKLEEKNWNEEWEKNFQPVRVDDFCAVRASFHEPMPQVLHEIIITPKMSFGTGHHATTYMMMDAMRTIGLTGKKVLDFGTGTGVLAILAEKLGAGEVLAIDNDEWSIANATENVLENQCTRIVVENRDRLEGIGQFGVILANINKNTLIGGMASMGQHLEKAGVILLSGLLNEDEEDIRKAAAGAGFSVREKWARTGWICLQLKRTQA